MIGGFGSKSCQIRQQLDIDILNKRMNSCFIIHAFKSVRLSCLALSGSDKFLPETESTKNRQEIRQRTIHKTYLNATLSGNYGVQRSMQIVDIFL